jgi:hypothetical protein
MWGRVATVIPKTTKGCTKNLWEQELWLIESTVGDHPLMCIFRTLRVIKDGFWYSFKKLIRICAWSWSALPFCTEDFENGTEMETTWCHCLSVRWIQRPLLDQVFGEPKYQVDTACYSGVIPGTQLTWLVNISRAARREHVRLSPFKEKQFCPFWYDSCMEICCTYSCTEATTATVHVFWHCEWCTLVW